MTEKLKGQAERERIVKDSKETKDCLVINAENAVLGRLSSLAAKEILKGRGIVIVNAEKCVISGNPLATAGAFREKTARGDPYHGPFYPKTPDRIVRRVVRGMLPKGPKRKMALKNLRVFASIPKELEGREFTRFKGMEKGVKGKFLSLGELVKKL